MLIRAAVVLTGQVATRVRDLLRQIAAENELQIISGKVAADHVHMRSSTGEHLWARGYFAVTSGTITDEMINEYINEQEGEAVQDDSRFQIDPS
jgi:putative transposase